ncbi:MAG: transcription-repair coupling factor [Desulfobacterales bacterium]|uniref:Transcription-repair-coupling factor n=1 Tax=Candidatus Desulfatibia profunda TaxID=2841695 RepID=A0A8J6NQK2_9BACT|nr:transcription-repair coupling factor [Candidatus Desulfatibia profunda]MBL7178807.1 transcription-repair coupling factor [Desulfobacterales bacterium]
MNQNQEKISLGCLIEKIHGRNSGIDCIGLTGSDKAYLAFRIYQEHKIPLLVIVPSSKAAEAFLDDLRFFLKKMGAPIIYFPPYNILPFKDLAYHSETVAERIRSLYRLTASEVSPIVVTTVDALLQKVIPKQELLHYVELIMVGEEIDRDLFIAKLLSGGYVKSMIVEEPGDFCARGGILDVFSPLYSDPLRIELFGDTVESLRFFSAANQRTTKIIQEAIILPAKETILKKECLDEIISRIRKQASVLEFPVTKVRNLVNRVRNEGVFPGIEGLIPLIYPELDSFFDYVPNHAMYMLINFGELEKAAEEFQKRLSDNFRAACNKGRLCVEPHKLYLEWPSLQNILISKKPLKIKMLPMSKGDFDSKQSFLEFEFSVKDNTAISLELKRRREKGLFSPLANWINAKKQSGIATFLVCHARLQADRLKSLLAPYGIQLRFVENFTDAEQGKGLAYVCLGQISSGFVWPDESVAIITEDEIFGAKYQRSRIVNKTVRAELLAFEDLKQGDLVVHDEHGIGKYQGLVKLKLNGAANDFLLIIYQDDDKLYLPVDRMSMIQKYMGVNGFEPVLDKMGGKSWARVKDRVKRSAEKIAGELLNLYAERRVKKGYAFKEVDREARDFEAGFPYEETADQLRAIEEVLQDMRLSIPMDRLVCGDVGYGKTEVALRASFTAVDNGKQVAVLVPTTVLAEQHFATFSDRFERCPVTIACLSRFRSLREQRNIINGLKSGQIDIVIGTHRLLQKDVVFKDLGLFVLDEEQRFGVRHKEKLKKIKSTVDVLALTATPIPRTLHMSLMGIRDISVISTPPEQRQSIITYISEFDEAVIAEAVRKELDRGGQIFFVHNNIHSIGAIATYLKNLVPEVRLDVAHGRLGEDELERVMLRFMKREIDMLVCTTIIESGLDIPSANTIIINRADRFGLAQMYQLRGRVGRVDEQAYAYLFIPGESHLGKDAQKRLKVLMEHSDLGSGFQIAMSDLKIRGGGTILGASQSGHIAAVGYDMFLKLMENAMAESKGNTVYESLEPEININMSAFIPESYIPDIDQRLSAYRRLAKMTTLKELTDFRAELIDRFGDLMVETENLLLKIMLKVLSIKAGVKRLDLTAHLLTLCFSGSHQKNPEGIVDMVISEARRFELTPAQVMKAKLSKGPLNSLLLQTKNILKEISQRVNG